VGRTGRRSARSRPDEREREAVESIEQSSQKGFHRQHYSAMLARVQTALYRGAVEAAWRLFAEQRSRMRRELIRRFQVFRVESPYLRPRSALAKPPATGPPADSSRLPAPEARRIASERRPWSDPIALLLRAGKGSTPLALKCIHDDAARFEPR
jgi:hypothetical protein